MAYAGGEDCAPTRGGGMFTSTGTILVLFILLVIISRTVWG
ncbi:sporulation protein YjcZ [Paenibacillus pinistramenti]|nr:sporulation protein YjcZ [Paenibacillus pinistramenti]